MKHASLAVLLLAATTPAWAQTATPVTGVVEGAGVKVGEGTVIHPILGIESGVISNVFYAETDPRVSGLLRITGDLVLGALPPERLQAPSEQDENTRNFGTFAYRADLQVRYEQYLSGNDAVQAQSDVAFAGLLQGVVHPHRTWQFAFSEDLRRETRAANFESQEDVDRLINNVGLRLRYRPVGRTLWGEARFQNTLDFFENTEQRFANRMQNTLGVNGSWQLLPVTRLFADVSLGLFGGLGSDSTRPSSLPLRTVAGISTALTVKSTLLGTIGYGRGFYGSGPDFSNVIGGLQFGYRYSPQARFAAMYEYDFHDSINANFYRDHALKVRMEHRLDRFAISAAAELRLRSYRGVIPEAMGTSTDRSDVTFAVPLTASYNFRDWIAMTIDYRFVTDQTDFRYMAGPGVSDDPSFTRHTLMAGVRAAY